MQNSCCYALLQNILFHSNLIIDTANLCGYFRIAIYAVLKNNLIVSIKFEIYFFREHSGINNILFLLLLF